MNNVNTVNSINTADTADLAQLCINTIRTLSIDAVQQANSRPPGNADGTGAVAAHRIHVVVEDVAGRFLSYGWNVLRVGSDAPSRALYEFAED